MVVEGLGRDEWLKTEITRVWRDNFQVYRAEKVLLELNRQGITVARCTVTRLRRERGIQGGRRGRKIRTTIPGMDGSRAGDLVNRDFTPGPEPVSRARTGYLAAGQGWPGQGIGTARQSRQSAGRTGAARRLAWRASAPGSSRRQLAWPARRAAQAFR